MQKRNAKMSQLAGLIKGEIIGPDISINGLGFCNRHTCYDSILSYVSALGFIETALLNPSVKALIITKEIFERSIINKNRFSFIIVDDAAEEKFYELHHKLYYETPFYDKFLFESIIGTGCSIHRTAVIEQGVIIGDNVRIGANSVINTGVQIGNNTHIGCCSVIGSEGFQILRDSHGKPYNVKHVGETDIGNDVWIGDNVTVCNAIFEGAVTIGNNTLIDNHSQISHNCTIGTGNVLTCGVIMFGSSELKSYTWLAPGSMVMNRVIVGDNAFIGANSTADKTVPKGATIIGTPGIILKDYVKKQLQIEKIIKEQKHGK